MAISFLYNSTFFPPAPIAEIGISHISATMPTIMTVALVDSGADVTMLPLSLLRQSGASYVEQKTVRGILGTGTVVHRYLAAVYVGGVRLLGIRIAGHPEVQEAVIGRDVLNQLTVLLDGPAEILEIR